MSEATNVLPVYALYRFVSLCLYSIPVALTVEVWSKAKRSKPLFPLKTQKSFVTLFPTEGAHSVIPL